MPFICTGVNHGHISVRPQGVWLLSGFQSQNHPCLAVSGTYTYRQKQQEHLPRRPKTVVVFPEDRWDKFPSLFHIGCALNHTDDVVSLGEEGYPVVEGSLLLVIQILPFGLHILGLDRRLCKRTRGVFAGEDCWLISELSASRGLMSKNAFFPHGMMNQYMATHNQQGTVRSGTTHRKGAGGHAR